LVKLHRLVPLEALGAIVDEVDKELIDIKNNMPEHPLLRSTGWCDGLKTSITPSQSSSTFWKKKNELERNQHKQASNKSNQNSCRRRQQSEGRVMDRRPMPELEGSDIDPPSARTQQSIELVEEWFQKCDEIVALNKKDDDMLSVVSEAFGGIGERPKVDAAAIWGVLSRRSWKGHFYNRQSSRTDKYIYSNPSNKLDLDMGIVERISLIASRKGKGHPKQDLDSLLRHKKAEKLSKRRNIPITEAIEKLEEKRKRRQERYSMHGGRSPGSSLRTALECFGSTGQGGSCCESTARISISLNGSEVRKCLDVMVDQLRDEEQSELSVLSSRPSPVNMGSLVERSRFSLHQQSTTPSLWTQTYGSTSSAPRIPVAIGQDLSPIRPWEKPDVPKLRRETRHLSNITERGNESDYVGAMRQSKLADKVRTAESKSRIQEDDSRISEALRRSRERRAERATNTVPFNDRYRHDERDKHWGSQKW
jgi:hypothetical protein